MYFKVSLIKTSFLMFFIMLSLFFVSAKIVYFNESFNDSSDHLRKPTFQTCEDSDGKNFFNSGSVKLTKGNNSLILEDSCFDNSTLIEYVCIENKKKEIEEKCDYGCNGGKCLDCLDTNSCDNTITGEVILETECEDGTLLNECNSLGFKCIDLELVEDLECTPEMNVVRNSPQDEFTGEIIYIYAGKNLIAKNINNNNFYLVHDYLGSLSMVLDENKNTVEDYDYLPFGETIGNKSGKYTDKEYDKETGLYYYGARYYNPETGRFTQTDPVDSVNSPYMAFNNNPNKYIDPDGKEVIEALPDQWLKENSKIMEGVRNFYQYKLINEDPKFNVIIKFSSIGELNKYFKDKPYQIPSIFIPIAKKGEVIGGKIVLNSLTLLKRDSYKHQTYFDFLLDNALFHEFGHSIWYKGYRNVKDWNNKRLKTEAHIDVYDFSIEHFKNLFKDEMGESIEDVEKRVGPPTETESSLLWIYHSMVDNRDRLKNELKNQKRSKKNEK